MNPKDGGGAFPKPACNEGFMQTGMSIRRWFAGQAMVGLLASDPEWEMTFEKVAELSYKAADAMLAEGDK